MQATHAALATSSKCSLRWRVAATPSRHPELINRPPGSGMDRPDVEADPRYRRTDYSTELAADARAAFAQQLAQGEPGIRLAKAVLLVAAEDDAIASHTTVPFPVDSFLGRIKAVAVEVARLYLNTQPTMMATSSSTTSSSGTSSSGTSSSGTSSSGTSSTSTSSSSSTSSSAPACSLPPEEVAALVHMHLFGSRPTPDSTTQGQGTTPDRFDQDAAAEHPPATSTSSSSGGQVAAGLRLQAHPVGWERSALPRRALVDHPGVWEDARGAYLHEVLVRRRGHPAALGIIFVEVMQQLLLMGAIDFAVQLDTRGFTSPPRAIPLPNLTRQQVLLPDGSGVLNTCSSTALEELLVHLKRAYWPFPWDTSLDDPERGGRGSHGGFRAAVKAALSSEDVSAALRAVSATAAHRLSRGIWTSPGAGDLRRARAAAERLVMMVGEERPQERRDLAILLLHSGELEQAAAELAAYRSSKAAATADPFDAKLVEQLWELLQPAVQAGPLPPVTSVASVLQRHMQQQKQGAGAEQQVLPLTW